MKGFDDGNELLRYALGNLWGNPEENQQYQVATTRLSDYYGDIGNFNYMNNWRSLPKKDKYFYVFSAAGLSGGFWNFANGLSRRNPLDRWINIGRLMQQRGMQIDIYNTKGYQYSRSQAWVMLTYDGLVLIALEKSQFFELPTGAEIFFRVYRPTTLVSTHEGAQLPTGNPFAYETMVFELKDELAAFNQRYQYYKLKPGFTGVFWNGAFWNGSPASIPHIAVGDVVEFWHDPTVIRTEIYSYKTLPGFYSELDKKRKLIVHPPKKAGDWTCRYFDDNDYYLLGKGNAGLYFHRNSEAAIRQLTHVDVAIADDQIQAASEYHPDLKNVMDIRILVLVRKTDWVFPWPHEHQRIRYLYRLPDADILKAMTGERSTVPVWQAPALEAGMVQSFTRSRFKDVTVEKALKAVGYNAATRVLAETPLRLTYNPGSMGLQLPVSYRDACTVWEHDAAGKLISYYNLNNALYVVARNPNCALIELTSGNAGRNLEYVVTDKDLMVSPVNGFRVYLSDYSVATSKLVGALKDVTGDSSVYTVEDGMIVWKNLDPRNSRGVVVFNTGVLAYTFQLNHLDHSLSFAITYLYDQGGLAFPIAFADISIWLNGHPLIDNVDWFYKDGYCYIINKQFITQQGPQQLTVRCHDFWEDQTQPRTETELGFVDGGVIGRFKTYNLREDRVTRTVIGGALYPTDEVPSAELTSPKDLLSKLNGKPYMVKHTYTPLKYARPYDNFPLLKESREVDQSVSDYLTKWLPKPQTPAVIPSMQDKYRVFSPFLSVLVNGLINRIVSLPVLIDGAQEYSSQAIHDVVAPYLWWLEHDPVIRKFDLRYFAIMPYANAERVVLTAKELAFIKQVNDRYLNSTCVIEGNFSVNNNVR